MQLNCFLALALDTLYNKVWWQGRCWLQGRGGHCFTAAANGCTCLCSQPVLLVLLVLDTFYSKVQWLEVA
jgi:hypothetical protein